MDIPANPEDAREKYGVTLEDVAMLGHWGNDDRGHNRWENAAALLIWGSIIHGLIVALFAGLTMCVQGFLGVFYRGSRFAGGLDLLGVMNGDAACEQRFHRVRSASKIGHPGVISQDLRIGFVEEGFAAALLVELRFRARRE